MMVVCLEEGHYKIGRKEGGHCEGGRKQLGRSEDNDDEGEVGGRRE